MSKGWLFLSLPLLLLAGAALLRGIDALRQILHARELAVLPLAAVSAVDIAQPGEVVLALRGRLGARDFAAAEFTLRDAAGRPVDSSLILARSSTTSLSGETTLTVRSFRIRAAGRHELAVAGLDATALAGGSRLVLMRPGGVSLALRVAWVVAAAVLVLAMIVFSALVAFLPRTAGGVAPAHSHEYRSDAARDAPAQTQPPARAGGLSGHPDHGDRGRA